MAPAFMEKIRDVFQGDEDGEDAGRVFRRRTPKKDDN
jgi:hypothetical protein